jgi:hypothetical protein
MKKKNTKFKVGMKVEWTGIQRRQGVITRIFDAVDGKPLVATIQPQEVYTPVSALKVVHPQKSTRKSTRHVRKLVY